MVSTQNMLFNNNTPNAKLAASSIRTQGCYPAMWVRGESPPSSPFPSASLCLPLPPSGTHGQTSRAYGDKEWDFPEQGPPLSPLLKPRALYTGEYPRGSEHAASRFPPRSAHAYQLWAPRLLDSEAQVSGPQKKAKQRVLFCGYCLALLSKKYQGLDSLG